MTSIGGLSQYLSNNSRSRDSFVPSGLLAGTNASTSSTALDTLSLGTTTKTYDFAKDSTGKPIIATLSDLAAVAKPGDKLTIASQVAEAIRLQSDTAIQVGRADRVGDMTNQVKNLLDAMGSVVKGVATQSSPGADGKTDSGVTPYKSTLSTTLGRVAKVMASLQALAGKAPTDTATKVRQTLTDLNAEAKTMAAAAGLEWDSLVKAGKASLTSGGTTGTTVPRLLDYLA